MVSNGQSHVESGGSLASAAPHVVHPDVALDRDRAASMSDEGGVSAAIADAREELALRYGGRAGGDVWRTRLLWGAVAVGCALFAGTLFARFRRA